MDKNSNNEEKSHKRKRRKKTQTTKESVKKPIRLVSSLGEGKLIDRYQNAVGEKDLKRKALEKSERERRSSKEKREREMAKFKSELNALLEETDEQSNKQRELDNYVPKLRGTVKGKFEALERQKKEEEKCKIKKEREKRMTSDMLEKKRIQIEILERKQKGLINEEENFPQVQTKPTKKHGKIKNIFENIDKYYLKQEISNKNEETSPSIYQTIPKKLKSNFDNLFREKQEEERKEAEERKRKQLEEEKRQFHLAKLAAAQAESGEENNKFVSASSQNVSDDENRKNIPKRLSTSMTMFDILEKQREEDQVRNFHERRKALLEEELQLVHQEKRQHIKDENEKKISDDLRVSNSLTSNVSDALNSSLISFNPAAQQLLEEKRKNLLEKRKLLFEEEKKFFLNLKNRKRKDQISTFKSDEKNDSNLDEKRKEYFEPNKLAQTRLNFDIHERERMENERLEIQIRRRKLLEEEQKLYQVEREKNKEDSESDFSSDESEDSTSSSKSGCLENRKKDFFFLSNNKWEMERERIKNEKKLLLEEETKLILEERRKLWEIEREERKINDFLSPSNKNANVPGRLDQSLAKFDLLEQQRAKEEEENLYREKAKKLEEEKRLFKEAKQDSEESSDKHENVAEEISSQMMVPKKLSSQLTKFDLLERERVENDRVCAQKKRIKILEHELKSFEEERKLIEQEKIDDITSGTKQLLKLNRSGPRPKKLSESFTQFDIMEQNRREEERDQMKKKKAELLAHEREMFEKHREEEEIQFDQDSFTKDNESKQEKRAIRKIDIKAKMEAVLKAQEETERRRIEETKFTRMTVEQQEMFLAKQKQIEFLKQQLAQAEREASSDKSHSDSSDPSDESMSDSDSDSEGVGVSCSSKESNNESSIKENEDETIYEEDQDKDLEAISMSSTSTNSSGSYSGSPYFIQTLKNLTVTEGNPVRFDANINANPHPKMINNINDVTIITFGTSCKYTVMWYFKNRLIRNSPDYQYIAKGTLYSLYMNESFLDDVGEYMCKATNEKGTATSKAFLTIKGSSA